MRNIKKTDQLGAKFRLDMSQPGKKRLSSIFSRINKMCVCRTDERAKIGIKRVFEFNDEVGYYSKRSEEFFTGRCQREHDVMLVLLISIQYLSQLFKNEKPLRDNQASADPNFPFGNLLAELVSISLSLRDVLKTGREPAARLLLRSVAEISWTLKAISCNDKLLRAYLAEHVNGEYKTWSNNFRPKKLFQVLEEIEAKELGPLDAKRQRKWRENLYSTLSKSAHHGLISSFLSVYSHQEKKRVFKFVMFGDSGYFQKRMMRMLDDFLLEALQDVVVGAKNRVMDGFPSHAAGVDGWLFICWAFSSERFYRWAFSRARKGVI